MTYTIHPVPQPSVIQYINGDRLEGFFAGDFNIMNFDKSVKSPNDSRWLCVQRRVGVCLSFSGYEHSVTGDEFCKLDSNAEVLIKGVNKSVFKRMAKAVNFKSNIKMVMFRCDGSNVYFIFPFVSITSLNSNRGNDVVDVLLKVEGNTDYSKADYMIVFKKN